MLGGSESYIYGISDFTIGNAVTYKIDKYTSGVDNLTVKIGSTVVATRNNVSGDLGGTFTKTITFSNDELTKIYNAMPNVTRASFTFTITTVIGGYCLWVLYMSNTTGTNDTFSINHNILASNR